MQGDFTLSCQEVGSSPLTGQFVIKIPQKEINLGELTCVYYDLEFVVADLDVFDLMQCFVETFEVSNIHPMVDETGLSNYLLS